MKDYLEQAVTGDAETVAGRLEGVLTKEQVQALEQKERKLFGKGGDVRPMLARIKDEAEQENYRRLLPGYVLRFVEKAAPLLDLRIQGDPETTFTLVPERRGAADSLLPALEAYPEKARHRLTVHKPANREDAIWVHPGEPVFDCLSAAVVNRFGRDGLRGCVFIDPYATKPYLFHIGLISVGQSGQLAVGTDLPDGGSSVTTPKPLESRLIGLRQSSDDTVKESPVERLLLLRGIHGFAPSRVPLATFARRMTRDAANYVREKVAKRLAQTHRNRILEDLTSRVAFVKRGFDFQVAELAAARSRLNEKARAGDHQAKVHLSTVKRRQRSLKVSRNRRIAELQAEPELIQAGEIEFLVHALVVPIEDSKEAERYDAHVEDIAVKVATAYEERFDARVQDVSRPELARRAGLTDWPGFDLWSRRATEERAIEVKGRAGSGGVEMEVNEWANACNLRDGYWLYVVFDCATAHPRLVRVQDPFGKLLVRGRGSFAYTITQSAVMEAAE